MIDDEVGAFNPRPHGKHTPMPVPDRQGRAAGLALSLIAEQRGWEPDEPEADERWIDDGFRLYDEAVGPGTGVVHRPFIEDIHITLREERDEVVSMARNILRAREVAAANVAAAEERRRAQNAATIAALAAAKAAAKPPANPRDPFGRVAVRRIKSKPKVTDADIVRGEHVHDWRPGAGYVHEGKSYVHTESCHDCPAIREVEPYVEGFLIPMPERVVTVETPSGLHRELPVTALPKEKVPDAIFEPPPAPPPPPPPPKGKWERLIDAARERKGEWARTPWSMKEQSARAQASGVRNGRVPGKKALPGTEMWEATAGQVDGHWYVWVRFMGEARMVAEDGTA